MERNAEVSADYGGLVVFDPTVRLPVDSFDPDDLRPWFGAHAAVLWEESQGVYPVRVVDSLDGIDGVGSQKAHLRCKGDTIAVGSSEALDDLDEAALTLPAAPGLYLVTVVEEPSGGYAVHLAPVARAPARLMTGRLSKVGLERRKREEAAARTVPLLRQLALSAPETGQLLRSVARAVRAVPPRARGWWLYDGQLWATGPDEFGDVRDAGSVWVTDVEASPLVQEYASRVGGRALKASQGELRPRFRPIAGERRLYAWAAHTTGKRLVGVGVGLTGDAITDAGLFLANPLSPGDHAECLRLLREAFAAAPAASEVHERRPPTPPAAKLKWASDRLTVTYGPLRGARPPKLKVVFETDDGTPLPPATASVVRIDADHGVYDLWLVGPRAGCRRAVVTRETP